MEEPSFYFVALLETKKPVGDLSEAFNQICCVQPGSRSHGWRIATSSPRRYLFQFSSTERINPEVIYDLSMLVQESGKVISEATNAVSDEQASFATVMIIDTGYKIIGRSPIFEELASIVPDDGMTFLDGYLTLKIAGQSVEDVLRQKHEVERLLSTSKQMVTLTSFSNWKPL